MKTKRPLTAAFKTKIVLEAIKEQTTISSIAQKYEVHPNQVTTWKKQFLENAENAFDSNPRHEKDQERTQNSLYEQIGRLKMEIDFLKKAL
jgi:transposase-like protein